ncbi:MAG: flagellar assembly protein FliW [Veillonellales bacterium]
MLIHSTRFGDIDVPAEQILQFPHGIPGFPAEKVFAYLVRDKKSPFSFLQSASDPNLTFLLAEPFTFFNDYEFALDDGIAQEMGLSEKNPPQIFTMATLQGKLEDMTVNLLAPLVVNTKERTGRQIILDRSQYSTRQKLFPNGLPQQTAKGGK